MSPNLTEHFCIYLDLLGYSNRIKEDEANSLKVGKDDLLISQLEFFIQNLGPENKLLSDIVKHFQGKIRSFSDNIFIALPVAQKAINDFHLILGHIIEYQKYLIRNSYFLRGGVIKGKLFIDENTIWGSGLIKAVVLEKSTKYPFIGISDDILNLFIENGLLSDENEFLSIPIIKIIDGKYFLDYLQTTIFNKENKPLTTYGFLSEHKKVILYNIKNNYEHNILNKYYLLAKYHNQFCEINKAKFPKMKNHLIKNYYETSNTNYERKYIRTRI